MKKASQLTNATHLFECMSVPILTVDDSAHICFVNTAFEQLFGYERESLLNKHFKILIGKKNRSYFVRKSLIKIGKTGHMINDAWVKKSNGENTICKIIVDTISSESKKQEGYIVTFDNLQRLSIQDAALQQLAYKDELTGLANRTLFNQLLSYEIGQAEREGNKFGLLFLDLDKMKQVNDELGHVAGDLLLCRVSQTLQNCVRKTDVVARLGGDEFVIILNRLQDPDTVANIVEKIISEVNKIDIVNGHSIKMSCSVGISLFPENGKTMPELMRHADAAMYRAKKHGGNSYFYFNADINREITNFHNAKARIEKGLENKEFIPYFQPLIDVRSNDVVGIECLARWNRDGTNVVNPIEFIPIAKKSNLMHPILTQVLDLAFARLSDWKIKTGFSIPLSVNMTAKQFCEKKTFDTVDELLEKHGLTGDTIRVELTESTLQVSALNFIKELNVGKHASFSITLDDFGTGYSSLRILQDLPVDIIKIDRSFVRNIDDSAKDSVIIKAIIQMAHTLGIYVVAEGVETEKQRDFLLANGCYLMQGYLFSPPLTANDFDEFISR